MNLIINKVLVRIEEDRQESYLCAIANKLNIAPERVEIISILSKDLDLKHPDQFYYKMSFAIHVSGEFSNRLKLSPYQEEDKEQPLQVVADKNPIIIGFGPAGMFAAIELIRHGIKPIIFDRGKAIEERSIDVQRFIETRELDPESNIQYGEGGAGSFSDGKLFSRRNNNTGFVNQVLKTFVEFGANADIVYVSKPHLGTDVLCRIVRNIRHFVLQNGGEIHYSSKVTDILVEDGVAYGVVVNGDETYLSDTIFLGTGHSSRDTYEMMYKRGFSLEQRPISIGVRIEHPREHINLFRYGSKYHNYEGLGSAAYSVNYTDRETKRGVYTFCMCPGGEIINASSENGHMVINGMSYSHRASNYSNGALVVSCHPSDYPSDHPLAGIELQIQIESATFKASGESWKAPAQMLTDFIDNTVSTSFPENSFKMGVVAADMRDIFPPFIIEQLEAAFSEWKEKFPLFITEDALLFAAETRTSSPVRVVRDSNYESVSIKNVFPIGEGSGHTGGITSSAADGIKAVARYIDSRFT